MSEQESKSPRPRSLLRRLVSLARWFHVYVSMVGLLILLFFAATGIVMNHPDWFLSGDPIIREETGTMDAGLLNLSTAEPPEQPTTVGDEADFPYLGAKPPDYTKCIDEPAVVELLRARHHLKGAMSQLSADEYQCTVSFEAPGYAADVFIERSDGTYEMIETFDGLVAVIGDLHKGAHSGKTWLWVIDVAGLVLIISALTGLSLLLAFHKRRRTGLLAMVLGGATIVAIYALLVP